MKKHSSGRGTTTSEKLNLPWIVSHIYSAIRHKFVKARVWENTLLFSWFLESFIFQTNLTLRHHLKDNPHLSPS